jgi:hypothetical protein
LAPTSSVRCSNPAARGDGLYDRLVRSAALTAEPWCVAIHSYVLERCQRGQREGQPGATSLG